MVEENVSLRVSFEVSDAQSRPSVSLSALLSADLVVELTDTSPTSCLHEFWHASHHDDNGLNF